MANSTVTTGDVQLVRRLNRDAVLGLIRDHGPISRTAFARLACQVMEQTGRYLGIGVATLVNLLNPDLVIIGGGVILAGAPLLEPIGRMVKLRTTAAGRRANIVPAKLGVQAPAIGAAALVMIKHGLLPTNTLPIA